MINPVLFCPILPYSALSTAFLAFVLGGWTTPDHSRHSGHTIPPLLEHKHSTYVRYQLCALRSALSAGTTTYYIPTYIPIQYVF